MRTYLLIAASIACLSGLGYGRQPVDSDSGSRDVSWLTAPVAPGEIPILIQNLGDSSYLTRTHATRRLCAVGMESYEALKQAAKSDELEKSLRANELIQTLDRLYYSGVEVTLLLSKQEIDWDESVDLHINMINHSSYPARIPFDSQITAAHQTNHSARQVAGMLDAAEWITVRHPGKREVALKMDDFASEPDIVEVVQQRLDDGPFFLIEPGQRISLTVRDFNRGWARYLLLDKGEYSIVMDYVPAWSDKILSEAHVGRVTSPVVKIKVITPAPDTISRSGQVASLKIVKQDKHVSARLINRTDQPMIINTNFGDQPPFSQGRWIYQHSKKQCSVLIIDHQRATWNDFQPGKLVEVKAGASVELSRIGFDDLSKRLKAAGADLEAGDWKLSFNYTNLFDRPWQRRRKEILQNTPNAPDYLLKPLSSRLLSARHTSNELTKPLGN